MSATAGFATSPDTFASDDLLDTLLAVAPMAIMLLRPTYEGDTHVINDLACVHLNPAAQLLLRQPAQPSQSLLTLFPQAQQQGVFDFYCDIYRAAETGYFAISYQQDGLDYQAHLVARRSKDLLVVTITTAADPDQHPDAQALQASQAREQAARTEADLQRQQLHNVLEQAPAMICIFDGPQHTFQFVNPPYQALVGQRPLVGMPIAEAMPELAGQPIFGLLDRVYETGETFFATEMLVQLDHENQGLQELEKRYYNFIYQARHDTAGVIDGILVFAYEVTAQVRARHLVETKEQLSNQLNEELAAANEEIRANNEALEAHVAERTQALLAAHHEVEAQQKELQHIMQHAPVAIGILRGSELRVELLNEAMSQLWGRPAALGLGRPLLEVLPGEVGQSIEQLVNMEQLFQHVLQTGEPLRVQELPVVQVPSGAGKAGLSYFSFTCQPLHSEPGRATGLIVVAVDVTEQVLARQYIEGSQQQVQQLNEELAVINEELAATNEELNASNEELGDSNQQLIRTNVDLDNFIYSASHDLRQPISNIEGLLAALREELAQPAEAADIPLLLTMMQAAVERFKRTIDHLTDIAKLQKSHSQAASTIDLASVVEDVRQDLLPQLQATGGQLVVDVANCPTLAFSEKNLRSIVYNLLSNGLKYQRPGYAPHLLLRCFLSGSYAVLEVQDNGLGLSTAQQQKLFGLFQRLHDHVEGSGIGLYMVKKIMDNAGGHIEVESYSGMGSTFRLYFPYR